jgi:hypothetical protein
VVRFASCESDCPALLVASGLLRQYVRVLLRNRGDPSPRPCGHFPAAPAMLGTANGAPDPRIRASLHYLEELFTRVAASAAGCRRKRAPPEARRGCVGRVRRRAHTMCARSLNVHGRTSSEPRSTLADLQGRTPGRRAAGGVFLWLPFFAQAKKVTRLPAGRVEALLFRKRRRRSWITRDSCRVPFGPFAARMFAPASCLRSPAFAGMTSKKRESQDKPAQRARYFWPIHYY